MTSEGEERRAQLADDWVPSHSPLPTGGGGGEGRPVTTPVCCAVYVVASTGSVGLLKYAGARRGQEGSLCRL